MQVPSHEPLVVVDRAERKFPREDEADHDRQCIHIGRCRRRCVSTSEFGSNKGNVEGRPCIAQQVGRANPIVERHKEREHVELDRVERTVDEDFVGGNQSKGQAVLPMQVLDGFGDRDRDRRLLMRVELGLGIQQNGADRTVVHVLGRAAEQRVAIRVDKSHAKEGREVAMAQRLAVEGEKPFDERLADLRRHVHVWHAFEHDLLRAHHRRYVGALGSFQRCRFNRRHNVGHPHRFELRMGRQVLSQVADVGVIQLGRRWGTGRGRRCGRAPSCCRLRRDVSRYVTLTLTGRSSSPAASKEE
ncbi:hypothetical protein H310_07731 [Aphanomyces invadans]|uniref:Uncharacterized protein n=1 Tax=Aphanomyces invadans TaxID=157072 RepID=A0A024U073_9STRA|nr:hypothetical protein H310_07731 [Aphanomyces invadans]ETV99663.1 hypothetical protein H310_07731 [Aphanomyces invadans]|eukprot:XP_008871439.1 hypothetical protein H310_07731 [Aphanomyces invadans]